MKKRPILLAALAIALVASAVSHGRKEFANAKHQAICEWLADDMAKSRAKSIEDNIQGCTNMLTALAGAEAAKQCPEIIEKQIIPKLDQWISEKLSSAGCK